MRGIFQLGIILIPFAMSGCQTTAIGQPEANERSSANAMEMRQSIDLTDGRKLTFNVPGKMTIAPAQGFESSGIMFFDGNALVRVAIGSENGSVSCLPNRDCKEVKTENSIGEVSFYLERLERPRSGEDIMHPTHSDARFPIAIRSLSTLGPRTQLFIEGFCLQEISCEAIISSFDFATE
ncbi:hypothetical protein [Porphyrobacter sp. GA68]|uniref:hypothetical protein n=1 Tax=Porphyrobacter sp. GA68 TaxID=2883480 RepID=UPI001D184025|nr:hypothetical protein [Porphyrobacter sp. GA68]